MDVLWHVLNFFAPAVGIGLWASVLAKLLWWRALRPVGWWPLLGWAIAATTLAALSGLVLLGHDGKMLTYGAMVVACSGALWWRGFGMSTPTSH
ncbi:MAG: hypothetical protein V4739_07985 [Pseudomonadota bacterium]